MTASFTINGKSYQSGRIELFCKAHLLKRLAPILPVLTVLYRAHEAGEDLNAVASVVAGPLTQAITRLSDADAEFVYTSCLGVTQRQNAGAWGSVYAQGGGVMFDDIDLFELGSICWHVLQDNFRPCASALRGTFPGVASPAP